MQVINVRRGWRGCDRLRVRDAVVCDLVREFALYGVPHDVVVDALEVAFDTGAYYAQNNEEDD